MRIPLREISMPLCVTGIVGVCVCAPLLLQQKGHGAASRSWALIGYLLSNDVILLGRALLIDEALYLRLLLILCVCFCLYLCVSVEMFLLMLLLLLMLFIDREPIIISASVDKSLTMSSNVTTA